MTAKPKRARATGVGAYSGSEWELGSPLSDQGRDGQASHTRPHRTAGRDSDRMRSSGSDPAVAFGGGAKRKGDGERMGGLPLPDVVRQLLRDPSVLKWHPREEVYEVTHGENFELRFNELRKVRSKPKAAGTERPFSRMYNFFVLEQGDKWAKTGTRFKPRSAAGYPRPETVTASDMKKERSVSKSPAQGPVQVPTRAPEPKRAQQAQPQAKTTTHAIRPVSAGRNAHILGNRPSPPPPTPERARLDATTRALDEDDAMQSHGRSRQQGELQLHQQQLQLLGKRRREYDERLGAPQPGQAQSVRRLRTVDAGAQERCGYASAWHTSPSVRWRYNNAAMLGEEERGYLHRMRPEVREEVLSPMLHGMHKPSSRFAVSNGLLSWPGEAAGQGTGGWAQTVDAADAMHDRDMTHGRGAEYAYSSMPTAGVYMHAPGFRERAEPHDDADEDEDEHVPAKPGAFSDKMNQARLREVSGVASGEAVEDGFSACWATPDTVVAIDEEFVGSPLDLGDSECGLSVLLPDSPLTSPAVSASKKCGDGLVFDAMEDAAWGIADFSGGPW